MAGSRGLPFHIAIVKAFYLEQLVHARHLYVQIELKAALNFDRKVRRTQKDMCM